MTRHPLLYIINPNIDRGNTIIRPSIIRGRSLACLGQHLQPRIIVCATTCERTYAQAKRGVRSEHCCTREALTAPPMIRVGSLSGVAASLLCFRRKAAGRNIGLKLCVLMGWVKYDFYLTRFADNERILILYGELRV